MLQRGKKFTDRLVDFFRLTDAIPERIRRVFIGMLSLGIVLLLIDAALTPFLSWDWPTMTANVGMSAFLGVGTWMLWRRRQRQELVLFAIFAGAVVYLLFSSYYDLQQLPPTVIGASLLRSVSPWLVWFIILEMTGFLTFRAVTALRMALITMVLFFFQLALVLFRIGPIPVIALHDIALLFISNLMVILLGFPLAQSQERSAQTDFLTTLSNRSHGYNALSREIERARRYGETFAIILFDIDHFKKINDSCGHPCGDAVLREVAAFVNAHIRRSDLLCRWGGEEFLLLMPHCDLASARLKADHLRQQFKNRHFHRTISLTASFGITAYYPYDTENTLLERADNALYRAKRNGRNCVEVE
jgi:diguanylate cyclase (GGDEF)-like protein